MNNDNRNDGGDKIAAVIVSKSVLVSWGQGGTNMQQEVAATLVHCCTIFLSDLGCEI